MNSAKPVVIVGAGGHGKVLFDICRASSVPVAGYLDKDSSWRPDIHGLPILGTDDMLGDGSFVAAHAFVLGIGDVRIRRALIARLEDANAALATLIHPSAAVSEFAEIGRGSTVHAGAVVCIDARIGAHCVVNTGASVDHDCVLADGVQIGPGARLAGGVVCDADVFVGTGASVVPGIKVGKGSVVGAGSSAARDVPENVTVFGVPARIVRDSR